MVGELLPVVHVSASWLPMPYLCLGSPRRGLQTDWSNPAMLVKRTGGNGFELSH